MNGFFRAGQTNANVSARNKGEGANFLRVTLRATLMVVIGLVNSRALAADNVYTNSISGKWETATNWSLGAPTTNQSIFITNTGTKAVTIDGTTVGAFPDTLTVTNLLLSSPAAAVNTLLLSQAGLSTPFHVLNELNLSNNNALLVVDNSAVEVGVFMRVGMTFGSGNQVIITNGGRLLSFQTAIGTGSGTGTSNRVVITGPGSTWINTNLNLTLANSSPGVAMMVTNGGRFVGSIVHLGSGSSAAGEAVIVTDPGSAWTNLGPLRLGPDGSSDSLFVVSNGAFAFSASAIIGKAGSTNQRAWITDSDSVWLSTGAINVITNGSIILTNGGSLFVTNASQTASLSIDAGSLILANGSFKSDHLVFTNGGSLTTLTNFVLAEHSGASNTLSVSASAINVASNFLVAPASNSRAIITLDAGASLTVSNGVLGLGNDGSLSGGSGNASLTVSNANLLAATINLGSTAGGSGSVAIQSNATVIINSNLTVVSGSLTVTNSITVAGGLLSASNATIAIAPTGRGQMKISGGIVTASEIKLGGPAASAFGSLDLEADGFLRVARLSANAVCVGCTNGGGDADGTGGIIIIGEDHDAVMMVRNGTVTNVGQMFVGYTPGFHGMLTNYGLIKVTTNLIVGDCISNATGTVVLEGGTLIVTNAAHSAVLDVRKGTLLLKTGATLIVDNLIITNDCATFVKAGGTLQTLNPPILAPNLDADGDGQSNSNELRAGTDPLNPNSCFRLLSTSMTTNRDVRLDWTTVGGHSYVVQIATNLANGSTNGFRDLSPTNSIAGTNEGTTNYVHIGGATNLRSYYRIRLGP